MKTEKIRKIKDNAILILWTLLLSAFFSFLFCRQAIRYNNEYPSDLPALIDAAVRGKNGSTLLFFMKKLLEVTHDFLYGIALFEGLIAALTFTFTSLFFEKKFAFKRWSAMLCAFFLLFLTSVPVPLFPRYYADSLIAQPWHNIAYLAMRLFAVPALNYFMEMHRICLEEKRISVKHWLLACGFLFLSTNMKPGFLLVFSFTLLIFMLKDLTGKKIRLKHTFLMGTAVVPSLLLLIVQFVLLKMQDPGYHINAGISIYFLQDGAVAFIMRFVTGLFLPVLVLWFNRKKLTHSMVFAYAAYAVSIIEAMFLTESGDRLYLSGFMWGMQVFAYLLYMYILPVMAENVCVYVRDRGWKKADIRQNAYIVTVCVLLIAHAISGMHYYNLLMHGADYYM